MVYCAVVCKMIHNFVKLERLAVVLWTWFQDYVQIIRSKISWFLTVNVSAEEYFYISVHKIECNRWKIQFFMLEPWMCLTRQSEIIHLFININQLYALEDCSPLSICAWDSHLQVWWYQRLYNTILPSWRWAHVLKTCRGLK
jgi:hypothetical protein